MPTPLPAPLKGRIATLVVMVLLVPFLGWWGAEFMVEKALWRVAEGVRKSGYIIRSDDVDVDLFEGRLVLRGASISPDDALRANDSLAFFSATADRVGFHGVDHWSLMTRGLLHVRQVHLEKPVLEHSRITGRVPDRKEQEKVPTGLAGTLARIRIDTLRVTDASARSIDRRDTAGAMVMERMDLLITGLRALETPGGGLLVLHDAAGLDVKGTTMPMKPFHTLSIGRLQLDAREGLLRTTDLQLVPHHGPNDYHEHVSHQSELMSFSADTVLASGFDLASNIRIGALMARSIEVLGLEFHAYRDKSIPADPTIRKPLPQEALRSLSLPVSIDSISFKHVGVHYSERTARDEEYGTISFTGIHGSLTGLSNLSRPSPPDLHLKGEARLHGRGELLLDMRCNMTGADDLITAHAAVRNLPFEVLNRMTDNLVHVKATDGRLQLVELRFNGDRHKAQGSVDVHYKDLKLALSPSVEHARALSFLANTLVRSNNLPEDRRYRRGMYTVDRAPDKGIFNYLWRAMREGMLEVMLPPMVLKRLQRERERQRTGF